MWDPPCTTNLPSNCKPIHITLRISQPPAKTGVWDSQCITFLGFRTMHCFPRQNYSLAQRIDFQVKLGCIPFLTKTSAWDFKTRFGAHNAFLSLQKFGLGFGTHCALILQEKLALGTYVSQQELGFGTHNALLSQKKKRPWDSQCLSFPPKTRFGNHNAQIPKSRIWQFQDVICILHTAYAQFNAAYIAPPRGLKSPPEKRVCLALLVHAGIIVLRYPALC